MTPEHAAAILYNIGIEVMEVRGYELIAKCPGHLVTVGKEDENPSWSLNAEMLVHHCFSCGFRGSLSSLVAKRKKISLDDAKIFIKNHRGLDVDAVVRRLDEIKDVHYSPVKPIPMSEARLAVFVEPPDYALSSRSLTRDAASFYGILWDGKTDSWIVPIRDESGILLGWQEKSFTGRFFRNRPLGVKKSSTLFGIDRWSGGQMVVVESPLDAVRLLSAGVSGGVATYGAAPSATQVAVMSAAETLVIAFDNDPAGLKANRQILALTKQGLLECRFFDYGGSKAKDVGDMTPMEIARGLENAKHCVYGESALRSA